MRGQRKRMGMKEGRKDREEEIGMRLMEDWKRRTEEEKSIV